MTDIQEQVEQFIKSHFPSGDPGTPSMTRGEDVKPLDEKGLYALLRAFLEECCKAECTMCYDGVPIIKGTTAYHRLDSFDKNRVRISELRVYRYEGEDVYECLAHSIRHHFAWLEEK